WHGLVLFVVLAGFAFTARQLDRTSRFQRIDRELQQRAALVTTALRRGEPQSGPGRGDGPRPDGPASAGERNSSPSPPQEERARERRPATQPRAEGERRPPPPGDTDGEQFPPLPPPDGEHMPERQLPMSQTDLAEFDGTGANAFYYI